MSAPDYSDIEMKMKREWMKKIHKFIVLCVSIIVSFYLIKYR